MSTRSESSGFGAFFARVIDIEDLAGNLLQMRCVINLVVFGRLPLRREVECLFAALGVLQRVAECCSALRVQRNGRDDREIEVVVPWSAGGYAIGRQHGRLGRLNVWCSVCVAVCCSVFQSVCCSVCGGGLR